MVATTAADTAPDGAALLHVEDLSRVYGGRAAVENLSFSLHRGEVFGLLGVNGAGKTTSLRMICGTLAPSAGRVRIAGLDLHEMPRRAKSHIGFLPEVPPLDAEARVNDFLDFAAAVHRVPRDRRGAAVQRALERCGLTAVRDRLIRNLSKGFQQRVGIAQALVHEPDLIVLDEPTVGLDPLQVREIRQLVAELREEHAVVLSSHILPEIQAVCDRVLILNRGRAAYADRVKTGIGDTTARYNVVFARPPESSDLRALAGVRSVADRGSGRFTLDLARPDDLDTVQEAAGRSGWRIREIVADQPSLEAIFTDVTAGESLP